MAVYASQLTKKERGKRRKAVFDEITPGSIERQSCRRCCLSLLLRLEEGELHSLNTSVRLYSRTARLIVMVKVLCASENEQLIALSTRAWVSSRNVRPEISFESLFRYHVLSRPVLTAIYPCR